MITSIDNTPAWILKKQEGAAGFSYYWECVCPICVDRAGAIHFREFKESDLHCGGTGQAGGSK